MPPSPRGAAARFNTIRASRTTGSVCSCLRVRIKPRAWKRCSAKREPKRCDVGKGAFLVGALLLLGACDPDTVVHKVGWFATMRHQRNIKPYARPIPPVAGAVPTAGGELPV